MATIKFPSEMPAASDVGGNDKLMISKDGSGEAFQVSFNAVKQYLEITDIELSPVQGGESEESPTIITAGPSGQNRKMDASPGFYQINGIPVEADAGHVWKMFWNGTTWSLVDMGELPMQDISNLATKDEVAEKVGYVSVPVGKNKFNKETVTPGYINSDGVFTPSEATSHSQPIPIKLVQHRLRSASTSTGARFICAYNSAGIAIPSQGSDVSTSDWTPTDTSISYIVVSVPNGSLADFQVEEGATPTAYEPYQEEKVIDTDARIQWGSVSTLSGKVMAGQVDFAIETENKFDKNAEDISLGRYVNGTTGSRPANAAYNATGYIQIPEDVSEITVNIRHQYAWYNDAKVFISGGTGGVVIGAHTIPKPEGAVYYAQGVPIEYWDSFFMVVWGNEIPSQYVPFGYTLDTSKISVPKDSGSGGLNVDLIVDSITGKDSKRIKSASLNSGTKLSQTDVPYHIKKNTVISAHAEFTTFTGNIQVGKGLDKYRGCFIEVTPTNVICRFQASASVRQTVGSVTHGLTIEDFLNISIYIDESSVINVAVHTKTDLFKTAFTPTTVSNRGIKYEANYEPFIQTNGQTVTNVTLTSGNLDFKNPMWVFADSYGGVALNRWAGQLRDLGFLNFMLDALAGINSTNALAELNKCLSFGTPKYLFWGLGMNDSTLSAFEGVLEQLKSICQEKGIVLILQTTPTIPSRDKEAIAQLVRDSGYRYVDVYQSVGATPTGEWIDGYLSVDGVHPTEAGAKAIAMQFLIDLPEIMQYGKVGFTTELEDVEGDN